jgi:4-hydroxybenzoate polyprenyltransferase
MAQESTVIVSKNPEIEAIRNYGVAHALLISMRPYQWLKNLFVLMPLLFGRKLAEPDAVMHALFACLSFCLMSSAIYIFNDIIDANEDRAHPEKRSRPIPSGALTIRTALLGAVVMLSLSLWLAIGLGSSFLVVMGIYFVLMIGYCVILKQLIVLDAMTIASGFVLRVVGGAIAVQVKPTHWLIACAFLLALYLAFAKRRQELLTLSDSETRHRQVLDSYTVSYLDQVNNILIGATVVCYALYTVAPETVARFETDSLIYGTIFVIYGLLRYMALIQDPTNGGDPSKMLMKDRPLLLAVICWVIYNAAVIYGSFLKDL